MRQRLFFALWPPAALQASLASLAEAALAGAGRARAVPAGKLHLTLVFLGQTDAATRACFEDAAARVQAPAFSLTLDTVGFWRRTQLLWCGARSVPPALAAMREQLVGALAGCGYAAEPRPFAAHVTLARNLRRAPPSPVMPCLTWTVDEFSLVESVTCEQGARYEIVRRWALGAAG